MNLLILLLIIFVIIGFPAWPHSHDWGYGPSGIAGVVLIILIVLLISGRL